MRFQARLQLDSATQISLQRYQGLFIDIAGEDLVVPSGGIACTSTDNAISSTGTDSGAAPTGAAVPGTRWYAYVSNSKASFAPSDLRLCATAPTSYLGVDYLATSGNGLNWRFVGRVAVFSAGNFFRDDATNRGILNAYNRIRKNIELNPGYVDDDARTSYTRAGNFAAANGGTGATGSFLADGSEGATFRVSAAMTGADRGLAGIGVDSTTQAIVCTYTLAGGDDCNPCSLTRVFAEGAHSVNLLVADNGAGTLTIYADSNRVGSAADPIQTCLFGDVPT